MSREQKNSFEPKYSYALWLNPGTIKEIAGIDELKEKIPSITLQMLRKSGDVIVTDGGMRRILAFMIFTCKEDEYDNAVSVINRTLIVRSESGEIMNCSYRYDRNGYAVRVD